MLDAFDLVIFDCDGVLVDSERLVVGVEAEVLTALGWPMTAAEVVDRWMGRSSHEQLAEVAERLGPDAPTEYERRCLPAVREAFRTELTAVPGVTDVVAALARRGVPDCVASSGTPAKIRLTLGLTGLWDHFDGRIFSAVQVDRGKPAPDLFLLAAREMGVDPAACAVVEDSVPGVAAAVAAGMTAFGYGGGLAPPGALAAAGATVVASMAELA